MTNIDLDTIEARANAATEGPWSVYSTIQAESVVVGASGRLTATIATPSIAPDDYGFANAEFIAHARTDVPALVAEVRAERAKLEKVFQYCVDSAYADINPYELAELLGRAEELERKRDEVFDD